MSSPDGNFPLAKINIEKFNRRLPIKLDREQEDFPRLLRKARYIADHFKSLTVIYDYVDRVYSHADNLVACRKGCSFCCHVAVRVEKIEADFIEAQSGRQANQQIVQPSATGGSNWLDPARPCPFLKDDSCSIYPFRPLMCRTYVNFEPTNDRCRFESANRPMAQVNRDTSFPGVMQAYRELVIRHGGHGGDIRDFFSNTGYALASPVVASKFRR